MKGCFVFLLLVSLSFAKHSYSDKCYRYLIGEGESSLIFMCISLLGKSYYQYYVNKDGTLLSQDEIVLEYTTKGFRTLAVQYYYQ